MTQEESTDLSIGRKLEVQVPFDYADKWTKFAEEVLSYVNLQAEEKNKKNEKSKHAGF